MSSTKKLEDKGSVASKVTPMYHIAWKSMLTDASGHGTETFSHEHAELVVKALNSRGNLNHWAELIQPDAKGEN